MIVLGLLAGACSNRPSITAIEIVPAEVVVGPDPVRPTTFELEARLWTGSTAERRSIGETQGYTPLKWTSDQAWLTVVGQTGFRATLQVTAGAASAGPASITVKAGDPMAASAKIWLAPATFGGEDGLTASYSAGKEPDVVLVNGVRGASGSGPCTQDLCAFVARAMLGNLVAPSTGDRAGWDAAVLAPDYAMAFPPAGWTLGQNPVDAGTKQKPPLVLPVSLHVMVGDISLSPADLTALQNDVLALAQGEIFIANSLLADARTGIQLAPAGSSIIASGVSIGDCFDGDSKTSGKDVATLLNVYYVNDLGEYRGLSCARHNARPQDVIYVSRAEHSHSSLVHEVGHTLGLTLPYQGHADVPAGFLAGFDATNIMTSGPRDLDPVGRRYLTVGQVFRMNADPASWLNWALAASPTPTPVLDPTAPRLACQCGASDPAGVCPRLVADVGSPSGATATANSWDCGDLLWLKNLPIAENDQPVAILAGRSWRSPLTASGCSSDLPGLTEQHWSAMYIKFANLTRPGTCRSWAAIFFKQHGVLYLPLTEPAFLWSQTADMLPVDDPMLPRVDIAVNAEYPAGQPGVDAEVASDITYTSETFGEQNRTGITLNFAPPIASTSCSTTAPGLRSISVCYVASGAGEGNLVGPGRIHVVLTKRTTTTLAHLVGKALGLQPLSASDPAFPQNIMQPLAADRGQKLTLGQVFRINLPLNTSLPRCSSDPDACPSVAADVAGEVPP